MRARSIQPLDSNKEDELLLQGCTIPRRFGIVQDVYKRDHGSESPQNHYFQNWLPLSDRRWLDCIVLAQERFSRAHHTQKHWSAIRC